MQKLYNVNAKLDFIITILPYMQTEKLTENYSWAEFASVRPPLSGVVSEPLVLFELHWIKLVPAPGLENY